MTRYSIRNLLLQIIIVHWVVENTISAHFVLSVYRCSCFVYICTNFQTDILDINDIFRDLGTMVHDQGELTGEY